MGWFHKVPLTPRKITRLSFAYLRPLRLSQGHHAASLMYEKDSWNIPDHNAQVAPSLVTATDRFKKSSAILWAEETQDTEKKWQPIRRTVLGRPLCWRTQVSSRYVDRHLKDKRMGALSTLRLPGMPYCCLIVCFFLERSLSKVVVVK